MALDKPWLNQYGAGVPATINPDTYPSLMELLEDAFRTHASKDMMTYMGSRWTFANIEAQSKHLAAWLQAQRLSKGARVAVMMPNVPSLPINKSRRS